MDTTDTVRLKDAPRHSVSIKEHTGGGSDRKCLFMANIRFIKPLNDNRIRHFSGILISDDTVNVSSPALDEIVRVTISKRSDVIKKLMPNNNANNLTDAPMSYLEGDKDIQPGTLSSPSATGERGSGNNSTNIENKDGTNNNVRLTRKLKYLEWSSDLPVETSEISYPTSTNTSKRSFPIDEIADENSSVALTRDLENRNIKLLNDNKVINSHIGAKTVEKMTGMDNNEDTVTGVQYNRSTENIAERDQTFCPFMKSDNTCDKIFDIDLHDVPEDELDHLPEISKPRGDFMLFVRQQTNQQQHQREQVQKVQNQEAQKHQSVSSLFIRRQRHVYLSENTSNYGNSRFFHRSISDAALMEGAHTRSLFRSTSDAEYNDHHDDEQTDKMMLSLCDRDNLSRAPEPSRFQQREKATQKTDIQKHVSENGWDKINGKKSGTKSAESIVTGHLEGRRKVDKNVSPDHVSVDRLRVRRCALADPENMIMRQDLRERIERDVQKRKSSMVRKIFQFFNVQLGLNREEDLI